MKTNHAHQIQKSKNSLEKLNGAFIEEAQEIESQNCLKAKSILAKMERTIDVQNETIQEIKLQGEKLVKIKESSIAVYKNAEAANEVSHRIRQESSIFPSFSNLFRGVKRWWKKDRRGEKYIESIKNRKKEDVTAPAVTEEVFEPLNEETVPGENKTDSELSKILTCVKKVEAGARTQLQILKTQDDDINDITKIGEYSKGIVDSTEKEMRKR
ncbi:uncharacterized protein VICG_02137 [Vittaforma corneae ATCC 50505]|uniref:t-SNARE coiled-coil homology domain-containing protein n=1 Tax=Vittaforma corneae (strain ATCC 50505) TaxID=993615 RepID=L2GJL6_VITCO|nr:uncharacterized protein VICG_02137 [Vittaforma corneae ATCC 50505]ELA40824.1 hypothetical protein VICG_02137 [Vittaforma corneae ATCC 50505]